MVRLKKGSAVAEDYRLMKMQAAPSQATPDQWFGDANERRTEGRCSQELRGERGHAGSS